MAARPNVTNWHVQQARESLEVYYERFRGIALAPRPDGVAAPTAETHPAPLRETTRSRPMDQDSTTVQHPAPPKSMPDARSYAPGRPQVKPGLAVPAALGHDRAGRGGFPMSRRGTSLDSPALESSNEGGAAARERPCSGMGSAGPRWAILRGVRRLEERHP